MIEGKQCNLTWHVDDLKVSHTSQEVVETIIQLLSNEFGKESELEISHGKVHNYLSMILDFTQPGELKVHMCDYINAITSEMPKTWSGPEVNGTDPVKLDREKTEMFHHITMQLMYLSQCTHPDIRTAVSFLST